jgi:hypothetical protein
MALFGLLAIPVVIGGAAFLFFKEAITWKEFLLQLGVSLGVILLGWQIAKWGALRDTEHLNGRITRKEAGTEGCCHCRSVCDAHEKNGSCTSSHEECDHIHDYYWSLDTTVGQIAIENCSGWDDPPDVWVRAVVGEPATIEHGYTNYLLADPDSLMVHEQVDRYSIPKFPAVHDKYKVDPVVGQNVGVPAGWEDGVREINADLGARNQVDLAIVLTTVLEPQFAQALEAKWLYGPKNSLTVVMGVQGQTIRWVRVVTFSKVEALKVHLRDNLEGLELNDPKVLSVIRSTVQAEFKRTKMAEFAYLASTAHPTGWALVLLYILQIALNIGLSVIMQKHDVFGDERRMFRRSY